MKPVLFHGSALSAGLLIFFSGLLGIPSPSLAQGKDPAKAVAKYDKDGDGMVSRKEWGSSRKKAFRRIDADGDGQLTVEEVEQFYIDKGFPLAKSWTERNKSKTASSEPEQSGGTDPSNVSARDIAAIIDRQKPIDPEKVARWRRLATQPVPEGLDLSERLDMLHRRGNAAFRVGDGRRALADLREALRLADAAGYFETFPILNDLAKIERFFGNRARSVELTERALRSVEKPGHRAGLLARLVRSYASSGALDKAESSLNHLDRAIGDVLGHAGGARWGTRPKGRLWATAARSRAGYLEAVGRWSEAEAALREGLGKLEEEARKDGNSALMRDLIRGELGQNLMRQGRIVEAEVEVRGSLLGTLSRVGRQSVEIIAPVVRFVLVLREQGRLDEAERLARIAVKILEELGFPNNAYNAIQTQRNLAQVLVLKQQYAEAMAIYDQAAEALRDDPDGFDALLLRDRDWLLTLIESNRPEEALKWIAHAQKLKKKGKSGGGRSAARAMALAQLGRDEEAHKAFVKALEQVSASTAEADDEYTVATASDFRNSILFERYIDFLARLVGTPLEKQLGIDAAAEAFRVADMARGRQVQRALAASTARLAAGDSELAELVRREQDTLKRISAEGALLAENLARPTQEQNKSGIERLRASVAELRAEHTKLAAEVKKRFPEYAQLMSPEPPGLDAIRARLSQDEALIAIHVGETRTYSWAATRDAPLTFAVSKTGRERMTRVVEALRGSLNPNARTLADIPDFDLRLAHRLYKNTLGPVADAWKGKKTLLYAVNGALAQLPLSLLVTKRTRLGAEEGPLFSNYRQVPWLAREHATAMLPSAAALVTLRNLPPGDPTRLPFIGIGDPYFNKKQTAPVVQTASAPVSRGLRTRGLPVRLRAAPKADPGKTVTISFLPRLPDTAEEIRGMALAMQSDPNTVAILGERANETEIKSLALSRFRVVAFATHGLIPGELTGLNEPALALTAPDVASVDGDGLLTMSEILRLRLDADWVVLSACNTGSGRGDGAGAVSGLGRAFFYAGTRALLVSNWPVETVSARLLTTDLFRRQAKAGASRAEDLRASINTLIDGPGYRETDGTQDLFVYAHPIFWAPFTLVGDAAATGAGAFTAQIKGEALPRLAPHLIPKAAQKKRADAKPKAKQSYFTEEEDRNDP